MYEGLGEAYINVFFTLTASAFAAASFTFAIIWLVTRIRFRWCLIGAAITGLVFAYGANQLFHYDMFVHRHKLNNKVVPASCCISYEPSFGNLFASYKMTKSDFERWISEHPWKLQPYDLSLLGHDEIRLNFTAPELAYATEMSSNGGQLRVYYKNGFMYLSQNVM